MRRTSFLYYPTCGPACNLLAAVLEACTLDIISQVQLHAEPRGLVFSPNNNTFAFTEISRDCFFVGTLEPFQIVQEYDWSPDLRIDVFAFQPLGDKISMVHTNEAMDPEEDAQLSTIFEFGTTSSGLEVDQDGIVNGVFQASALAHSTSGLLVGCRDGSVLIIKNKSVLFADVALRQIVELQPDYSWQGLHLSRVPALARMAPFVPPKTSQLGAVVALSSAVAVVNVHVQEAEEPTVDDAAHHSVIEEVEQMEPATQIPPDEAASIAQEQWSQRIQLMAGGVPWPTSPSTDTLDASVDEVATSTAQPECLLPNTRVLMRDGACNVLALSAGDELVAGRVGHDAVVRQVCRYEACERRMVMLHLQSVSLQVKRLTMAMTQSHVAMVCPQQQRTCCSFRPMMAASVYAQWRSFAVAHISVQRGAC